MIRGIVVIAIAAAAAPGCVDSTAGRNPEGGEVAVTRAAIEDADALARSWRWNRRVVLALGPERDLSRQATLVGDDWAGWLDRDLELVLLTRDGGLVVERFVDGGPVGAAFDAGVETALEERFGLEPVADRFQAVLVGKDGGVKHRWSAVVEPAGVFDLIDAMPMRIREMREDDER
ncbi:MAG: DUF4174 domain-containing protein [Planctomycetota bacterium]|nr:DUF4174 domain-containing protein [Planctomycetota bacterium]